MIINWLAAKAQQFLPAQDAGLDELSVSFDFALSAEIMDLLSVQNDDCMDAGGRATQGAVAEAGQQPEAATAIKRFILDEHEQALA